MLKTLLVKNYALIENISIDFDKGFNIITGETGAGKSILLGALGLIQGSRADTTVIRKGETKCIVEAQFDIGKAQLKGFFKDNDLDFEELSIIRREVNGNGKSRAFINDSPVNLSILRDLMTALIDIHSQHETLQLKEETYLLGLLDGYSQNDSLLINYQSTFRQFKETEKRIKNLQQQILEIADNKSYNDFQLQELEEIELDNLDQGTMELAFKKSSNAENIVSTLHQISALLEESDRSVLNGIGEIEGCLSSLSDSLSEAPELLERVKSVFIELKDINETISEIKEGVSLSPKELIKMENVLNRLYSLQRKHNKSTVDELLEYRNLLKKTNGNAENLEIEIQDLEKEKLKYHDQALLLAEKLSDKRKKSALVLSEEIIALLTELKMPDAEIKMKNIKLKELSETGINQFEFLFQPNKGEDFKVLHKIASGGELSRLILGIKKSVAGKMSLPTIIFDEIDTGVSGDVAQKLGNVLKSMSKDMQLLCITHLPQVAGKGDFHFKISKHTDNERTYTNIVKLDHDGRVKEIAQMIAGDKITNSVKENAKQLLR